LPLDVFSPALTVAVGAYALGVASPGPSNLAIMAAAMSQGRGHAVALAGGVVCGSVIWGLAAALGLSALLRAFSWTLVLLKILGGLYMLWLAWKAARSVWLPALPPPPGAPGVQCKRQSFMRGLGLHLTNPKAVFVWLSIVALALPADAQRSDALRVVGCCALVGAAVFSGYALAFSTAMARRVYVRIARWFNAALSATFAYAGLRLLFSRGSAA
jgi:threonine efflux protein